MIANEVKQPATKRIDILRVSHDLYSSVEDTIAIEEPLEIRIVFGPSVERTQKPISVTMRTPGDDEELAVGFLFTEGIIDSCANIKDVYAVTQCNTQKQNIVVVELIENCIPNLNTSERNFYTSSSCGVCGKGSIQSIKTVSRFQNDAASIVEVELATLYQLAEKLTGAQSNFSTTGGIHAAGLFSASGYLIQLCEDVGRHNALDKLIGHSLLKNWLPLSSSILLLSGRASFELLQKAAMAGISVVVAIGAPSSLAVETAKELNITLIGFLKQNRLNIYHVSTNVIIPDLING
jgi:FdhD protein